jgi:hypothetical protein
VTVGAKDADEDDGSDDKNTDDTTGNTGSTGGSSGGGSSSSQPTVTSSTGGTVKATSSSAVAITPDAGYEIASVTVNGKAVAVPADGVLTGLKSTDRVAVTFQPVTADPLATHSFDDVPDDYWAKDAIDWAYEQGLVNGTSETTFAPDGTVSRQQLWMILARAAGETPADMAEAKAWAVANNISDGTNPGKAVTRQQLVAILYRSPS